MQHIEIRKIQPSDDSQIASIIRETLVEFDAPKVGTAYADVALDMMHETYNVPNAVYFVLTDGGRIIGGAGIAPLANGGRSICELQKMYFLPEARNRGLGTLMMARCLDAARGFGFTECYLETLPGMIGAQQLYRKSGFEGLDRPMGDTQHTSCTVWMLKNLADAD